MISIVMAYYNRKRLLFKTLQSIEQSAVSEREVIIVDDGSRGDERVEDLTEKFTNVRVVRIDPSTKKHTNSCIPYNIGFDASSGDVVIVQNPECVHVGDILTHTLENLGEGRYLSYATYSADPGITMAIRKVSVGSPADLQIIRQVSNPVSKATGADGTAGWYNHSTYKPRGYHFCSAIRRSDLTELGGFDERFAHGMAFDDDEFLMRIKRYGLDVRIVDDPFVIHQFHGTGDYWRTHQDLVHRNALLHRVVQKETGWRANRSVTKGE